MKKFNREDKNKFSKRGAKRFADDSSARPGRRDFGGRGRQSGYQDKFQVTCDKCGKSCEVPFKPTNSKPVYCSECFSKNERSGPRVPSRSGPRTGSGQFAKELEQINRKLDRILDELGLE